MHLARLSAKLLEEWPKGFNDLHVSCAVAGDETVAILQFRNVVI
jgi:hypothetical protein